MADLPEGYQPIPEDDQKKARAFFDQARTRADTGNFDYAIAMMLEGLKRDPESLDAHQFLRDLSLKRKVSGGKDLGYFEKGKWKDTKDSRESMINREYLLAHDPSNKEHMLAVAQYAAAAGYFDTVMWAGPMLLKAIQDGGKPDYKLLLALSAIFETIKQFDYAIQCLRMAHQARPDDMDLDTKLKHLSAQQAMYKGNYANGGTFRDSIKDADKQDELMQGDKDIRSVEGMKKTIEAAERELAADPTENGKIMKLVDALAKTDDPEYESRAIEKLQEAYKRTGSFRYRARIGEINAKQMVRMERSLRDAVKATPGDEALKKDYQDFQRERITFELSEFRLLAENYPTESRYKFEIATRLFALQQFDEAIPALQQARQDPKYKTKCSLFLGRAFFEAQFLDEALDTFEEVISTYALKGDDDSKEMFYWRGRVLEAKENYDPAIKSYSQVAQWDFNYRDVQVRIKALRGRPK